MQCNVRARRKQKLFADFFAAVLKRKITAVRNSARFQI